MEDRIHHLACGPEPAFTALHTLTFNMYPERGSDAPPQARLKLSPRRSRAISSADRCGGPPRATSPRSLGRWGNDPVVLMLIAFALLVSPGVVYVFKIPLRRHRYERRRRSFLRSQPRLQDQYQVVRSDTAGGNGFNIPTLSMRQQQEQHERSRISQTLPSQPARPTRASERVSERDAVEQVWDGKSVPGASKQARYLRSWVLENNNVNIFSNSDFGCQEIEAMLAGEKTLLGHGRTRDVYLVERGGRALAVKALRNGLELTATKEKDLDVDRWEAAALDTVREHPNIVDLLGVCKTSSVSEYLPHRLDDLVLKAGAEPLTMSLVISMALDAARGLLALHEAPGGAVVHFDIRPQHLMLDAQGSLKINHLDACTFTRPDGDLRSCSFEPRAPATTDPWRSPEQMAGEGTSEKVDVYSMGLVFYTMLALKPPYDGVKDKANLILDGVPPPVDASWHPGFMAIVEDMWQRDPKARPSARGVVERLENLEREQVVRENFSNRR